MSNALFPTLPGLMWDVKKTPEFNTKVQRSVSLKELRASFASTPLYNFTLAYEVLRDDTANNELKRLMGFFLARRGSFDSFIFRDPDDSAATAMSFGTGDGSTTDFQLTRTVGAFTEAVSNVGGGPGIYANASLVSSNYSVSASGLVTFNSPPASNAALTWTGTYYYRCRFKEDTSEFNKFMRQLWENQQVEFVGSLGTKI